MTLLAALIAIATAIPTAAQQPRSARPADEHVNSPSLSEPWQQTLRDFDEWAQIQRLYTEQQVAEMREKILEKVADLPPEDSDRFRDEVNAKLHVMLSAEARDARKWLTDTLAVASDSYAKKVRAKMPDVVKESSSDLAADLDRFGSRQTNVKQYQQGMQKTREMQIKSLEENARRQAEANAKAREGSVYNPAPGGASRREPRTIYRYQSPYGPTSPYSINSAYRFW